jgi:hypothetical protein
MSEDASSGSEGGEGGEGSGESSSASASPSAQFETAGANAAGKYFLIEVPNFNNAESEDEAMTSYLRLGAVHNVAIAGKADAPRSTGEDLASKARRPHTRIDGVNTDDGSATRSEEYTTFDLVFEDDIRERDPSAPITPPYGECEPAGLERVDPKNPGGKSLDSPLADLEGLRMHETAQLHTKGGWRDHSDGNRISTTRGDKVEVIRGNYKLVVLGRQEEIDNASGWDLSGGEMRSTTLNWGEFEATSVEWVEDDGGRWRCVEKNQKGDEYSIWWGDVHEEWFGAVKSGVTGSEDPSSYPHAVPGASRPAKVNPKIIERTWAESIEEYTGSIKRRIPTIKEETWAESTTGLTDVLYGVIENTIVGGGIIEAKTVGAGTIETTTVGGGMLETTTVGLGIVEVKAVGGGIVEATAVGLGTIEAKAVGLGTIEATAVAGSTIEATFVGGTALEITGGPSKVEIDLVASAVELRMGLKTEIFMTEATEICLTGKTEIETLKEEIKAMSNEIKEMKTELTTETIQINTTYNVLAVQVVLM